MTAALPHWSEPELPPKPSARPWPVVTPGEIPQGVWRGSELGSQVAETVPSGWAALDAQLPGGGWPRRSLTEQMIKSDAAGAIVAWLPQARQEQIRRLQVCALTCKAPVFLCRPEAARHDSSAAPLRLHTTFQLDWELEVDIFKRRGPAMDASLRLPSIPGGLSSILTPRLLTPSRLTQAKEASHAVGSPAPRTREHALH